MTCSVASWMLIYDLSIDVAGKAISFKRFTSLSVSFLIMSVNFL